MNKSVQQSADSILKAIDALTEVRSILHETIDSPYFKGDVIAVRDRYDEVDSIIDDLESAREYVENINLDF
jgi:hypothetical protein